MADRPRGPWLAALAVLVAAGTVPGASAVPVAGGGPDCTIAAAGDIAEQGGDQESTAELVEGLHPTAVLTLGDNAYDDGSAADFRSWYEPSWGRFKAITRPAVGNHEYRTEGARGYLDYFGVPPYYSYDLCGWHLYSLDREISGSDREQELAWLRADLARNAGRPMLAVWHEPRWTSGSKHGSDDGAADLWDAVVAGGVRVVLNGHEHSYERLAEMDARGRPSPGGTREFVVGEGGGDLSGFGDPLAASEVRRTGTHGVLALTLRPDGYDWRLLQVGGAVGDQGSQQFPGAATGPATSSTTSGTSSTSSTGPGTSSTAPDTSSTTSGATPTPSRTSSWWLAASQAAYVKGTEPSTGFGDAPDLLVDAPDPARYLAFVMFDPARLPAGGTPVSAWLYLRATSDVPVPVAVYAAPSSWSQATLTWTTQPAVVPQPVGTIGPARAGDWVSVDVTRLLQGRSRLSVVLTSTAPGHHEGRFAADATASPPTLYLTVSPP